MTTERKLNPCPMCGSWLAIFTGSTDDSGGYKTPFVHCSCGFEFTPKVEVSGVKGESGWDFIYRKQQAALNKIYERLGKST